MLCPLVLSWTCELQLQKIQATLVTTTCLLFSLQPPHFFICETLSIAVVTNYVVEITRMWEQPNSWIETDEELARRETEWEFFPTGELGRDWEAPVKYFQAPAANPAQEGGQDFKWTSWFCLSLISINRNYEKHKHELETILFSVQESMNGRALTSTQDGLSHYLHYSTLHFSYISSCGDWNITL